LPKFVYILPKFAKFCPKKFLGNTVASLAHTALVLWALWCSPRCHWPMVSCNRQVATRWHFLMLYILQNRPHISVP